MIPIEWFNPRVLLSKSELDEIYLYEDIHSNNWLYPNKVLQHWDSHERWIQIPDKIRQLYSYVGRPTPLFRARKLEEVLKTQSRIYFKREDLLVNGSFKICSAIPQAYYGYKEDRNEIITETAAGQTGVAAALASSFFNIPCAIFQVRTSYNSKKLRRYLIQSYGATVVPSPSDKTIFGRKMIEMNKIDGSIAIATTEIFQKIKGNNKAMNIAGSLLDFTLSYCSIIGLETLDQLKENNIKPDYLVSCVGAGSSFGGFTMPFLDIYDNVQVFAVEPSSIPTLTKGEYFYDHPDSNGDANKMKMYSLGYKFTPSPLHASGLRYHAASPIISYLANLKKIKALAYEEIDAIKSALLFAKLQGIIVAPESSYTIKCAIDLALKNKHEKKNIIGLITGSGMLDLNAYQYFLDK